MEQIARFGMCIIILAGLLFSQTEPGLTSKDESIQGRSPIELVDEMWRMATQGVLLKQEGWSKLGELFGKAVPFTGNKKILVVSNDWGPPYNYKVTGNHAEVAVGYTDLGRIDSELRYTPPVRTEFVKTAFLYHLSASPAYSTMYSSGGKAEKKPTGSLAWKIDGSPDIPWTTVNTAIRYVLEERIKTNDPGIKKNADDTISTLLTLN